MATVSTAISGDESFSISMGDGSEDARAVHNDGKGVTVDPRDVGVENLDDEGDTNLGADTGLDGDDTPSTPVEPGEPGELVDLGEYDDAKFDTFDQAYRTDTGTLNLSRLSAEFFANADPEAGVTGKLNDGTYQFLEATLGVDQATIKAFEAGQVAIRQGYYNSVTAEAGGLETVQTLVSWGKENFSPEARKRFNEAYHSGDPERAGEALAALQTRFTRAGGKLPAGTAATAPRRRVNPNRSATAQGQSPGTVTAGFATRAEWAEARTAAAGKPKELAAVQKKLAASDRKKWVA